MARRLWIGPDEEAAYLVSLDDAQDVERWPAAKQPSGARDRHRVAACPSCGAGRIKHASRFRIAIVSVAPVGPAQTTRSASAATTSAST
jgi:hypothetical protein